MLCMTLTFCSPRQLARSVRHLLWFEVFEQASLV